MFLPRSHPRGEDLNLAQEVEDGKEILRDHKAITQELT